MFGVDLIVSSLCAASSQRREEAVSLQGGRRADVAARRAADRRPRSSRSIRRRAALAADRWDAQRAGSRPTRSARRQLFAALRRRALESLPLSRRGRSAVGAVSSSRLAAPRRVCRGRLLSWLDAGHARASAGSSRLQRQHRHFRRAVDPHRHVDRSDAAADEHRRPIARGRCRRRPETSARRPRRRSGSTTWPPCVWPDSTSGMFERRRLGQPPRIVREQDRRRARRRAASAAMSIWRLVQKRMPTRSTRLAADRQPRARVLQHLRRRCARAPPACRDRRRGCRGCRRRRAAPTAARALRPTAPTYCAIAPGDVVAAEDDEVGLLAPSALATAARDVLVRDPAAAVDVGEQADAQSGERRRQAGDRQRRARRPRARGARRDSRTRRRRSTRADAGGERTS